MSGVRVLVGTRKGAFVLTSDGKRERVGRQRPALRGLGDLPPQGLAGRSRTGSTRRSRSGWFGQMIQRSDDGGKTWEPVGNKFVYDGVPGTHQWYDGTPHPWEFKRVWHLEPSLTDPDTVYAGVEDAALFRSTDGGQTWQELPGLRGHGSGPHWQPGAGGHVPAHDPPRPERTRTGSSSPSPPRARSAPTTAARRGSRSTAGLRSAGHPRPERRGRPLRPPHRDAPVAAGRAVHAEALGRHAQRRRRRLVARGQRQPADRLRLRRSTSTRTSRRRSTSSRSRATPSTIPPDGKLRVYRSRTGGNEWEALTNGLPQSDCYVNVLRDAMAVDSLDSCGVYFGTTGGQVYASADAGDSWAPIVRDLPAVLSVEVQTLP